MQLYLYPLKCDIAVFGAARFCVYLAVFDKLVQMFFFASYHLKIVIWTIAYEC